MMKITKVIERLYVHDPIYKEKVEKSLFGNKKYSEEDEEAINTVEALLKTCEDYKYVLKSG
jgi:hypothetical protein